MKTKIFEADQTPLNKLYLLFVLSFYYLQLSNLNDKFLKIFLVIGILIGTFILLDFDRKYKQIIILSIAIFTLLYLFNADTRLATILITGYIFRNEKISDYFPIMFIVAITTFVINLCVGFNHMNGCGMHLGACIFLFLAIWYDTIDWRGLLILMILNIIGFLFTDSAQSLVCITIVLALIMLWKTQFIKDGIEQIFYCKYITISIPIIAFLNYYLPVCMLNKQIAYIGQLLPYQINELFLNGIHWLDELMSYRLSLTMVSLSKFGFKFIGQTLNSDFIRSQGVYFNVDSGYIQILQTKGLFFLLLYLALIVTIVIYLIRKKHFPLIVITIALALWSVNEDVPLALSINFILIYSFQAIKDIQLCICQRIKHIKERGIVYDKE